MSVFDMSSKKENGAYRVEIKIDPLPESCYVCPFFYMPHPDDEGTWNESWKCYLTFIEDCTGIALERYRGCPL